MIYTFYSYKGGVGRSMALANIAELFYNEGLRVLMIDWDLEAPGLENFFSTNPEIDKDPLARRGLADMLQDYKNLMSTPHEQEKDSPQFLLPSGDLSPYFYSIHSPNSVGGRLWLLPAGKRDSDEYVSYTNFVRTFDWLDFYENWYGDIFFEWFRTEILKLADVVLIDSRTGLSEMGGVCTHQLADAVIMFTSTNQQSVDGIQGMVRQLLSNEVSRLRKSMNRPLKILVFPSRVEDRAEQEKFTGFQNSFIGKFRSLEKPPEMKWVNQEDWSNYLWESYIPHVPLYSFGENLVVSGHRKTGNILRDSYKKIGSIMALISPSKSKTRETTLAQELLPVLVENTYKTKETKTIRIFISSPSDVTNEREVAYKAISDIQEILNLFPLNSAFNISVRAFGWENTPPTIGLPNSVILERILAEEFDIFILILWKRFDSPTKIHKKESSRYVSGTQAEFKSAYLTRSRNETGLPIIFVYQKRDDFSLTTLSIKEIQQYKRVVEFIENCQPAGKHPTLLRSFLSKDFEVIFRKNLLDSILKLVTTEISEDENPSLISEDENPSLVNWLKARNLSSNPFKDYSAEREKDLSKYYVPFQGFSLIANDVLREGKNWLFFSAEGGGKTALKQWILSRCAPNKLNSKTLALSFETSDLREALSQATTTKEVLLYIAQRTLRSALTLVNASLPVDQWDISSLSDPVSIFNKIGNYIHETKGYEYILCLLDIDPLFDYKPNSEVVKVLAELVSLPTDRFGFRLFLPNEYQTAFLRQEKYLGKCDWRKIKWEDKDLKELIRQRLNYYSINKVNPCQALAALCEPRGKMRSIDDEIIALSDQRPRAVIWLANRLLLEHCQNNPIPSQITLESWDKTLSEWWTNGQKIILGAFEKKEAFSMNGIDPYFGGQPLKLSKRSKMLIKALIEADSRICSKDELIHAAWIGSKSDGVSEKAVRQAVQRLKDELKEKNEIDPAWIKNIYDQGYQLIEPESAIKPGNAATIGRDGTQSIIIAGYNNTIIPSPKRKRSSKEDK
ncbi:MAG: hypothetical protein DCC59_07665 [Chloroflexi bacterium]|nr:winged helix-turn-helix domain-containing protein [Anaerolineales bacterium]RIK53268.1 MAG: hypothetical protein DCC59_07665 [Chloroflexota bacterium]